MLLVGTDANLRIGCIIAQILGRGTIRRATMTGVAGFRSVHCRMTGIATGRITSTTVIQTMTGTALANIPVKWRLLDELTMKIRGREGGKSNGMREISMALVTGDLAGSTLEIRSMTALAALVSRF